MTSHKDPFHRVALGFRFLFVAAIFPVALVVLLGGIVGYLLATDEMELLVERYGGERHVLAGFLAVLAATPLTMYLLGLIGTFLFLAVPAESRATGVAVLLALVEILVLVTAALRNAGLSWLAVLAWRDSIVIVELCLGVISKGLFILFVWRLGAYLDRRDLGRRILSAVYRLLLVAALAGVAYGLYWLVERYTTEAWRKEYAVGLGAVLAAVSLMGVYLFISGYVQYLRVLVEARRAILGPATEAGRISRRRLAFGTILILVGGLAVFLGWQDWTLVSEYQTEAQELTLNDLIRDGHGTNRHVRVKSIRLCAGHFQVNVWGSPSNKFWVVAIPADSTEMVEKVVNTFEGKSFKDVMEPRRAQVLVSKMRADRESAAEWNYEMVQRPRIEAEGYEGAVMHGIQSLSRRDRNRLLERCPDTKLHEVIVLDKSGPPSAWYVHGCLWGGCAMLATGLMLLFPVWLKPRQPAKH